MKLLLYTLKILPILLFYALIIYFGFIYNGTNENELSATNAIRRALRMIVYCTPIILIAMSVKQKIEHKRKK